MPLGWILKNCRQNLSVAGWCLVATWLVAVLAGFAVVIDFDLAAGEAGTAHRQRPADMTSPADADRPTLMLFAHPRCPCTGATLVELNHILTACPGAAAVHVYFMTPENPSEEWTKTAQWEAAARLPDTTIIADPCGALAEQFGVKTSGHVLLYSADGILQFSGGITAARGAEGANSAQGAVVALLQGNAGGEPQSPVSNFRVFGCPLFDSSAACKGTN